MTKDKNISRTLGHFFGVKNECYCNAVTTLQHMNGNEHWLYIEGTIRFAHEPAGIHHAWLCNGTSIIDPTQPEDDLIYTELRRWSAAEILKLAKEDIELPLTDLTGALRPQSPMP